MKGLYIFIGLYLTLTGICVLAGVTELDKITYGIYVTGLGIIIATGGFGSWRK